jgi:DNA mismatch repair protein MutS
MSFGFSGKRHADWLVTHVARKEGGDKLKSGRCVRCPVLASCLCHRNLPGNMSATPMMQQYQSIRRTLPEGTLLLFRLGDFYELFFEDAKTAAPILNVALTKRNGMPMCGVPFHAAEGYVARLIKAGHRVAICDQTSEPQPGRIVERQISQIISPGTVCDIQLLESRQNNFLAAVGRRSSTSAKQSQGAGQKQVFGLALLDVSTGEFRVT